MDRMVSFYATHNTKIKKQIGKIFVSQIQRANFLNLESAHTNKKINKKTNRIMNHRKSEGRKYKSLKQNKKNHLKMLNFTYI